MCICVSPACMSVHHELPGAWGGMSCHIPSSWSSREPASSSGRIAVYPGSSIFKTVKWRDPLLAPLSTPAQPTPPKREKGLEAGESLWVGGHPGLVTARV